jgi:cell division protein FtsI (penicillin-binding protein 3)
MQSVTPMRATPVVDAARRIDVFALLIGGVMVVIFCLLLVRVAFLQINPSAKLKGEMEPRVSVRQELPIRGDLLDRRGRVLSTTRVGYRVVVDPTQMKLPVDEAIVRLAKATGQSEDFVGGRIISRLHENQRRLDLRKKIEPIAEVQGLTPALAALKGALASALGTDETTAGERAIEEEAKAVASGGVEPEAPTPALKPIRYLPMSRILSDQQVADVRAAKIKGAILERVMIREYPGGPEIAPVVGLVGFGHVGVLGAEKMLNKQLAGTPGSVSYTRDARGKPLWIDPGQVKPSSPGADMRLSIDTEIQRLAIQELQRGVTEADAAGGRVMVFDPLTGEILAMADIVREIPDAKPYPWVEVKPKPAPTPGVKKSKKPEPREPEPPPPPPARYVTIHRPPLASEIPAMHRPRCVEDIYEPGSTFKPFVWSSVTELGKARAEEIFDTEGGRWHTSYGRYLEDVTKRATMTWQEVLINSSNIGMVKAADRITFKQLHDAVRRFGFGRRTNIGLTGEAAGLVTSMKDWSKYTQTSVAYGHEIAVTPVQMVRAFSAFCRPGKMAGTLPPVRLVAAGADDVRGAVIERVLPSNIAMLTRDTMRGVAAKVERNLATDASHSEGGWKYTMFGKSGTAEIPLTPPPGKNLRRPRGTSGYFDDQYNSSFIAGGPAEDPKLVVLCVIDDPGPGLIRARKHYGTYVAGPVVRRVMERSLDYLGVSPSPAPMASAAPSH